MTQGMSFRWVAASAERYADEVRWRCDRLADIWEGFEEWGERITR